MMCPSLTFVLSDEGVSGGGLVALHLDTGAAEHGESDALWLAWDAWGGAEAIVSVTGGRAAPLGITLRLGLAEAVLAVVALLAAPFALLQLDRHEQDVRARMLQLVLLAGALGLVMTRDLFNTFVFIEITGIATYALAGQKAGLRVTVVSSDKDLMQLIDEDGVERPIRPRS